MFNLTPRQLTRLWSELEKCYYSDNGYGGDMAEIYGYTLTETNPTAEHGRGQMGDKARHEQGVDAARNLFHVLSMFKETREVEIEVNDKALGTWLLEHPIEHRVHVRVKKDEE